MPSHISFKVSMYLGLNLKVQWLRLHGSTTGGAGSVPGWGTKNQHAAQSSQKQTEKLWKNCCIYDSLILGPQGFSLMRKSSKSTARSLTAIVEEWRKSGALIGL